MIMEHASDSLPARARQQGRAISVGKMWIALSPHLRGRNVSELNRLGIFLKIDFSKADFA